MHRKLVVIIAQRLVQVDHPGNKAGWKDTDAAEIEQVDTVDIVAIRPHCVVAKMRIAMNDAIIVKWHIPGTEHRHCNRVAGFQRLFAEFHQRPAIQPVHGQKAIG